MIFAGHAFGYRLGSDVEGMKTGSGSRAAAKGYGQSDTGAEPRGLTLGALSSLTGFAVRRIHQYLYAGLAKVVEQAGMKPHQFTALSLIVDNPEISQIDLARALQVKPSNMVPLIDELGSRGLVVRNPSPNTRRSYALVATEEGRNLRDRALSLIASCEDELLTPLSAADRALLLELSSKLCDPESLRSAPALI